MELFTDVALQTNEGLFRFDSEFWQTVPRDRFEITNDLWVGKLPPEIAHEVIRSCEPKGFHDRQIVREYAQFYAFGRNISPETEPSNDLKWDSQNRLSTCIALSRIVHPTTISLAYAARLVQDPEGKILEIWPGPTNGHGSAAFLAREDARDWLTVDDLRTLQQLYSKLSWTSLSKRIKAALFQHENASGDQWMDFRWPKLCNALDGLVWIQDDYQPSERQFVLRSHKLAKMLGVETNVKDLEKILEMRLSLTHLVNFEEIGGEQLRLHDILSSIIRNAIKRAILDPAFGELFADDNMLRAQLPTVEAKSGIIKAVRGTRDLLPPETEVWNSTEAEVRNIFRLYNFQEIRTPIFEETQLFARGVGEETDIVSKEMFTWEDRGRAKSEKSQTLTLRPENTAGVVRAYVEHKLGEAGKLQRFYYIGPQFRRERPQRGRYRQFYQIGAEVIGPSSAGSESPAIDAELLEMLAALLDHLGIRGWTLELNSVGCANDRPVYFQALKDALKDVVQTMCTDCQRRAETNPLRVLDCKVPSDQQIIEELPRLADFLDESCRTHFAEVQTILKATRVPFAINHRLVRGLDYYTRTAFEFTHGALGAQNAILGGGRYDGLSEALGGPPAPGIGFAIGEDRLVMTLQESAVVSATPIDVYVAPMGAGMNTIAAKLSQELRRQNLIVTVGDETFRLKKSLETASKIGARFALIVGENEARSGQFALKNLATAEQISVNRNEIAEKLSKK